MTLDEVFRATCCPHLEAYKERSVSKADFGKCNSWIRFKTFLIFLRSRFWCLRKVDCWINHAPFCGQKLKKPQVLCLKLVFKSENSSTLLLLRKLKLNNIIWYILNLEWENSLKFVWDLGLVELSSLEVSADTITLHITNRAVRGYIKVYPLKEHRQIVDLAN